MFVEQMHIKQLEIVTWEIPRIVTQYFAMLLFAQIHILLPLGHQCGHENHMIGLQKILRKYVSVSCVCMWFSPNQCCECVGFRVTLLGYFDQFYSTNSFFWKSDLLSHGVSSYTCLLPYQLSTTIRHRMVVDSNYHRIYGTIQSMVPTQLWFLVVQSFMHFEFCLLYFNIATYIDAR